VNADSRDAQESVLPGLEHLLVRAARRRSAPGFGRRRWILATTAAALALAGGAAATTGVLHVADGDTSKGAFSIESRPVPATGPGEPSRGTVCLQLSYGERGASYGCGSRPTATKPFGLLVADSVAESPGDDSRERVIYGLVAGDIKRVSVLGGAPVSADTEPEKGLPGRFFVVTVPHLGRIEVVGYDGAGHERARIGSLAQPSHPPLSHAEAVAQGDPAGFAPTFAPPSR
jgi:hypothetical protein